MEYRASLLASHGYAAMALDYTDSSKVMSADIKMETIEVLCDNIIFRFDEFCMFLKS